MDAREVNADGLIGPTHHYGGLAYGNVASQSHRLQVSSPRQAALEGLRKMWRLAEQGLPQLVFPPPPRPHFGFLQEHGFHGSRADILREAARVRPDLLSIAYSASAMWTANAATVSPSADTADGLVHITPANLFSTLHRRLEAPFTTRLLQHVFADTAHFRVHAPLPLDARFADEGAANHMRICRSHAEPGVEVFVHGHRDGGVHPTRYPARQTESASKLVATQHQLSQERILHVQQRPEAIDAGVFHNDVIALANESLLLCHEEAYVDQARVLSHLQTLLPELIVFEVPTREMTLEQAVRCYLFNSQLITLPQGDRWLLCPRECAEEPTAQHVIKRLLSELPGSTLVEYVDVRQSMQNGGGPACLRLRFVLTSAQLAAIHTPLLLTWERYQELTAWVEKHYREQLTREDLGDPRLLDEVAAALTELASLLDLSALYADMWDAV